jgi:hypothetical protein
MAHHEPDERDVDVARTVIARAMSLLTSGQTPTVVEVGEQEATALERAGFTKTLGVPRSSAEHSELNAVSLRIVRVDRPSHLQVH